MGSHIAKSIKTGKREPFNYFDKGIMAIIGKNCAVVKSGGIQLKGFLAWLMWLFIHIAFLIGFRNKLSVLLGWAWAYLVNRPDARIIVYPPGSGKPGA
jgi:NADH dehydrogenase